MRFDKGQTLSHYRLIEKIGEGGMGVVWKAEDIVLNRQVAIKVLPADVSRDDARRQLFLQEAQFAGSISDGRIVQIHEFGREAGLDFIVMEYVDGKPLNKLHGRPLPPEKVAKFGLEVASALSRAHRKGLIHRDLKPANLMVTPDEPRAGTLREAGFADGRFLARCDPVRNGHGTAAVHRGDSRADPSGDSDLPPRASSSTGSQAAVGTRSHHSEDTGTPAVQSLPVDG